MQPAFRVIANSADITAKIADRLISLEISDQAGVTSDRATIVIDDRDQALEIPKTGAKLEIYLGYADSALVRMGSYVVDEVELEGPDRQMVIRANAADMTGGIKGPKERSWHNVTFGALAKKIASEHKLTASIPSELAARDLGHVDQTESDMQLLTRICSEQGATFKIADGKLVIAAHAAGKSASGKDMPPAVIIASNCAGWSATINDRAQYKAVTATWHNHSTGERGQETSGSGEPAMTLKYTYANANTAKRAAKSKQELLGRSTKTVSISAYVGDPTISAERPATLTGFRTGIDGGDWVINSVTHSLSSSGYTTRLELESK